MSRLDEAISFAAIAHAGQLRKYSTLPYIVHPIEVMQIVATVPHDEAMLVAAVLHDVVEDTPVGPETIYRRFGEDICTLVQELTEVSVPGNRRVRKDAEVARLAQISARGQTVKLADLISNTKSIVEHDPNFATIYLREKAKLLCVLTKGNATLRAEAHTQLVKGETALVQHALGKRP